MGNQKRTGGAVAADAGLKKSVGKGAYTSEGAEKKMEELERVSDGIDFLGKMGGRWTGGELRDK